MSKKIVIIGAGPVGCYTAQLLKLRRYNPLVIEEHSEVGKPVHCTGLVGSKVFEQGMPFKISRSSILNTINGAVVHYDSQYFMLRRKNVAYVIDRERFDKELSKEINILYQNKFLGLERAGSGYVIETDKDELFADIVIAADGAQSALRKILNQNGTFRYYRGIQFRIKCKVRYPDLVEVYLKEPSFIWVVPESEEVVRIGTISENPYNDLQKFLKEERIKGKVLEKFGGAATLGICNSTVKENVALVGDAACQIKPLTFGGIYFGLKAASLLVSCIENNHIEDYDYLWRRELSLEIKIGLKIKEVYDQLNSEDLEKIFILMKGQKSLIEKIGDFEKHSRIFLEILKKPTLYPQIGNLFSTLFNKILQ